MLRAAAVVAVILIACAMAAVWAWQQVDAPGPLDAPRTVVLESGMGVQRIADTLAEAGIVGHPLLFQGFVRLTDRDRRLKPGEYAFPAGATLRTVADMLAQGQTVVRRFTVAEGLTTREILRRLAEAEGMVGQVEEHVEEGRLFPETYNYAWGYKRSAMIARMRAELTAQLQRAWDARRPDLPLPSADQALVLASVVEKETALADERPRVAAVFLNRLKRGMRLQADPTVVYAVTGGAGPLDRPLNAADLVTDSAYNTYARAGLPPGPIANVGAAALAAATNPAESDDLYFVADGSGGHVFARTLEEHNRNVARWRQMQRAPAGEGPPADRRPAEGRRGHNGG